MLHLLRATVNPALSLRECVENWDQISLELREASRKRRAQIEELEQVSECLS